MKQAVTLRLVVLYGLASLAALLVSEWALVLPTRSALTFLGWIFLGPIGLAGFLSLGTGPGAWKLQIAAYYVLATLLLGVLLRFGGRATGTVRVLAVTAVVLIWLGCSAYNFWFLSFAA